MKMLPILLITISCFLIGTVNAQTSRIYVSRHGGKASLLSHNFKYKYSRYSYNPICDTLLGAGSGYSICQIPKGSYRINESTQVAYPIFSQAIKKSARRIRRLNRTSGEFYLSYKKKKVQVKFFNADDTGEADLLIVLI